MHQDFIRTGGENYIHVSEIDYFVEPTQPPAQLPPTQRNDEEVAATELICTLVASNLVHDGDTLQIGLGSVSSPIAMYLGDKNDLGIHTEVIPGGIARLVKEGVITGKYKTVNPGKVVASAGIGVFEDELAIIDGNPISSSTISPIPTTCACWSTRRIMSPSTTRWRLTSAVRPAPSRSGRSCIPERADRRPSPSPPPSATPASR